VIDNLVAEAKDAFDLDVNLCWLLIRMSTFLG